MNHFQGDTAALRAFAGERQDTRLLRLRFPNDDAPAGVFMLANTLEADEGLGRDFVLTVGVLSDSATILHEDVLAKMVCIDLVREDATLRYFNGYVTGFRLLRTDGGFVFYEMTVEPWMAFLRLRHNNAAFHDLNGIDITGRIVEQYLKHDWRHRLTGRDAEVTYTCQYGESDHNFLHRQWEARGWFTSYEHRADGHTLVLADDSTCAAAPIAGARTDIPWQHQAGSMEDDGIHRWSAAQSVCSDRTTLVSFNFKHPLPVRVERHGAAGVSSSTPAEVYENTGMYGFRTFDDGEVLSQLRMEEIEAAARIHRDRQRPQRGTGPVVHLERIRRRRDRGPATKIPDHCSPPPCREQLPGRPRRRAALCKRHHLHRANHSVAARAGFSQRHAEDRWRPDGGSGGAARRGNPYRRPRPHQNPVSLGPHWQVQ
jgi:type VI secretion system secreted protein VgrG